jgi:hypothetical protein
MKRCDTKHFGVSGQAKGQGMHPKSTRMPGCHIIPHLGEIKL